MFFYVLLAPSIRRLTMRLSIASPSCMPRRVRMFFTHSPAKIASNRLRARVEAAAPGSPCRPQRPRTEGRCGGPRELGADDVQAAHLFHVAPSAFICSLLDFGTGLPILIGARRASGYLSCSLAQAIVSGLPPRMMSVPRPAMFVAMVTAPLRPAWATISASRL